MRTLKLIPALLLAGAVVLGSATTKAKKLKQVLTLQMPEGSGSNGAGVAYNPTKKFYYAVFAGNSSFPLAVFDAKGNAKKINLEPGFDVRGFWFNKSTGKLEGNAYGNTGYYSIALDADGYPTGSAQNLLGDGEWDDEDFQPEDNSVGVFAPNTNEVVFLKDGELHFYDKSNGHFKRKITINGLPVAFENINASPTYTGISKQEIALFDFDARRIYLVNIANGSYTKTLEVPGVIDISVIFNVAYCNGIYWIFNKVERKWYGYK